MTEAIATGGAVAPAPATPATPRLSPYKGLVPYSDEDAEYFFGRERERRIIVSNLLASRLTLLYGESGVGKTSVLRAGVVHHLREEARRALAEEDDRLFVVVEFATWRDDPIFALNAAIRQSVDILFGARAPASPAPTRNLGDLLQGWAAAVGGNLLIILDQFEEYFLYHGSEDGDGTFAVEFPRAVNRGDLQASFLVSIREDALAKLDKFKARIPNLFGNYLRVPPLNRQAGRETILRPVEYHNRFLPPDAAVSVEPELVERVLTEIQHGQDAFRDGERVSGGETPDGDPGIVAPYLQLVMTRLWDAERSSGSRVLRLTTLEGLGGATQIVRSHLDLAMAALSEVQREIAARAFRFLVTPAGTKIALPAGDLAHLTGVQPAYMEGTLEALAGESRILRRVAPTAGRGPTSYEIFHDVLALAVDDWRRRYEEWRRQVQAQEELRRETAARIAKQRRRTRRYAAVGIGSLLATVFALGLAVYADQLRRDAEAARATAEDALARAESDAHVQQALLELGVNPQLSLEHALQGWQRFPSEASEDALRRALSGTRLLAVAGDHRAGVWSANFSPDGSAILSADQGGRATIADSTSGETIQSFDRGEEARILAAAWLPDGDRVVISDDQNVAAVYDASTGAELARLEHGLDDDERDRDSGIRLATSDAIAADGSYVATGAFTADGSRIVTYAGGSAWVWDSRSGEQVAELELQDDAWPQSAAFSPDGRSVVTGDDNGFVRVWDVETQELVAEYDMSTDYVASVTYSPDGTLVAAGLSDGGIALWNGRAGDGIEIEFAAEHTAPVWSLRFSANGRQLVSGANRIAVVWEVAGWPETEEGEEPPVPLETRAIIRPNASWVTDANFSPDGVFVVAAFEDNTARVFDAFTGAEVVALRGHNNIVFTARFDRNGSRVVTSSEDGTGRVWRALEGVGLVAHTLPINTVSTSADGSILATGSTDETVRLWNPDTGDLLATLQGNEAEFGTYAMAGALSADGTLVLTTQTDGTVALWDAATGEQLRTCCDRGDTAQGAIFVGGSTDRIFVLYRTEAVIWDLAASDSGTAIQEFPGDYLGLAMSADGQLMASADRNGILTLYSGDPFRESRSWPVGLVASMEVAPDGSRVVTAGVDQVVRVWDTTTGNELAAITPRTAALESITVSPDGRRVVTGAADGSVTVWDADDGRLLGVLRGHSEAVNAVAVLPDGRIASGGDDAMARVRACRVCGSTDEVIAQTKEQLAIAPAGLPEETHDHTPAP